MAIKNLKAGDVVKHSIAPFGPDLHIVSISAGKVLCNYILKNDEIKSQEFGIDELILPPDPPNYESDLTCLGI